LPEDCRPILITDAGFRGPWFRAVDALGWNWVGRVRNKIKYLNERTGRWCFTDSLYKLATPMTRYVGNVALSQRHGSASTSISFVHTRRLAADVARRTIGARTPRCIASFTAHHGCSQRR
jgi:hypothetical protein